MTEGFFSCGQISGREVFEFRPELVDADDEEADDTHYVQGAGEDDEVKETGLSRNVPVAFKFEKCQLESLNNEIVISLVLNTAPEHILSEGSC